MLHLSHCPQAPYSHHTINQYWSAMVWFGYFFIIININSLGNHPFGCFCRCIYIENNFVGLFFDLQLKFQGRDADVLSLCLRFLGYKQLLSKNAVSTLLIIINFFITVSLVRYQR